MSSPTAPTDSRCTSADNGQSVQDKDAKAALSTKDACTSTGTGASAVDTEQPDACLRTAHTCQRTPEKTIVCDGDSCRVITKGAAARRWETRKATGKEASKATGKEACKAAGGEACKSAGGEACKSASGEACKSASGEACKSASGEACKSASGEACKSASGEAGKSVGGEAGKSAGDGKAVTRKGGVSWPVQEFVERSDAWEFTWVMRKFRSFFEKKGMLEANTQPRVDILSACEDVDNLGEFVFIDGLSYPLKQTGQMILEEELLKNPWAPGYFCQTMSSRFEKNPKPNRHKVTFCMMEFEIHGGFEALLHFERELLLHFGFKPPVGASSFPEGNYLEVCRRYGVDELTHEHEERLLKDFGPIFFLKNFPEGTSPFWNMQRTTGRDGSLANKCDVIMNGMETIGSAERSCDVDEMRRRFHTISGGAYAQQLYDRFGKDRVTQDLKDFFALRFIKRSGAGIGVARMIQACKASNLIPPNPYAILRQLLS